MTAVNHILAFKASASKGTHLTSYRKTHRWITFKSEREQATLYDKEQDSA
jgi:hypothetical protein